MAIGAGALVTATSAVLVAPPAGAAPVCVTSASTTTCTFSAVGTDTFTVPSGVTEATFDVFGAQGGTGDSAGGLGGEAKGTLTVAPGDVFQINVGGTGSPNGNGGGGGGNGGFNGGGQGGDGGNRSGAGGGGASDVRNGAFGLDDRLFVGGGGGGGAGTGDGFGGGAGGAGGGTSGVAGNDGGTGPNGTATGGGGGTPTDGGAGGLTAGCTAACSASFKGTDGEQGVGGPAPNAYTNDNGGGGGGGGGLYGGGGGASGGGAAADSTGGSGGGGGSGFATASATDTSNTANVRSGDGTVIITFAAPAKTDQTITFRKIPDKRLSQERFFVQPKASSGLPVTISSETPDVCAVGSHYKIKLLKKGKCKLVATQPGDDSYNAAPQVKRNFLIT